MIPDTLEGAILLSLIDFVLSFVVISFIGLVLAAFPLLNRLTEKRVKPGSGIKPATKAVAPSAKNYLEDDVVAISAAVFLMMGTHRIVNIGAVQRGKEWVAEGRAAHRASHSGVHRPGY